MTFTDNHGNSEPAFAPGHVYLGNLHRNRVCWDHNGTKLKVVHQGIGSVTVKRDGHKIVTIHDRTFQPAETINLAPGTVVTTRKQPCTD